MLILKAIDLHKEWNGVSLFEQVTFEVKEGERIALFGRNGVGKTTLLQGLKGRIPFDRGTVQQVLPVEEWGWLDQQVEMLHSLTVLEFVQTGSTELFQLKMTLERLQNLMKRGVGLSGSTGEGGAGHGPGQYASVEEHLQQGFDAVLAEYGQMYDRYLQLDGFGWEVEVEKCLQLMNLEPSLWTLRFGQLSGGQKTRAQLASLMVRAPKFIVLDEPTNHLDSDTLDWLEQWVRTYPGTVLYVSHDRTFIDRTATSVIELEQGGCRRYAGGYTEYRAQKELELRTQEASYNKQEQQRDKLLESIRRYSEWFQQSHNAAGQNDFYRSKSKKNVSRLHAKEAALERLDREQVQKPRETARLKMNLDGEAFSASTLLRMEDVHFAYEGERELLRKFDFSVNRGDRIAVMGPNGTGKSTLLKLIAGVCSPSCGSVRLHPQTKIGYFAQELSDLEMEETILDSLLKLPEMTQTQARTILGCFLFSREDAFKKIGNLSMGERCRVAFLMLFFGRANLLVLDEPTNYLDIETRERVEDALQRYPGALLLISHDRYLIRKAANRLVMLNGREAPLSFPGTYDEYLSTYRSRSLTPEEQGQENVRGQMELRLALLMGSKEPEEAEERQKLMMEIRHLRAEIARMTR